MPESSAQAGGQQRDVAPAMGLDGQTARQLDAQSSDQEGTLGFATAVARRFNAAEGWEISAALAYRTAAAIFPFLIFLTGAVSLLINAMGGDEPAQNAIDRLDGILSEEMTKSFEEPLRRLAETPSLLPLLGGLVASIWTGTVAGRSVIKHLNAIHGLDERRGMVRVALTALAISLTTTCAAVLAVVVLLLGTLDFEPIAETLSISEGFGVVVDIVRWPIALGLLTGAAAAAYALGPARDAEADKPRHIRTGSLVFGALWTLATAALVFYLANFDSMTRTYGALTGFVVMLAWVYITSAAFTLGGVVDAELEARNG